MGNMNTKQGGEEDIVKGFSVSKISASDITVLGWVRSWERPEDLEGSGFVTVQMR